MGSAASKTSKPPLPNQSINQNKNITIGVFGLDDAGKTSTIKVIDEDPTENISPTTGSVSTMVTNPLNKKQQNIKIIDVSGDRKFRLKSWSQYYDQIHGLIFVFDASDKRRLNENREILEDLFENEKLKDKPVLILANKQDQKGAVNKEPDVKRQLDIERVKIKYKIELCTALARNSKNKFDDSIRKGFNWLIRTIDDNYTQLNARITKTKNVSLNRKFNQSESDENENEKFSTNYRTKITSEKLPSINISKTQTKLYSDDDDDDDDYLHSKNELNKKKKLTGGTQNNDRTIKKTKDTEPKAFRSTYESFPEETPWSTSLSMLKSARNDDKLPRLNTNSSLTNDMKRRGVSPLIHDAKPYMNGSSTLKRDMHSDEDDYLHQKSKPINRLDNSNFSTNRFAMNTKKPTTSIYTHDNDINRRINTTTKKTYNDDDDDDDDEDNYLKKSTTNNLKKTSGFDDNKLYQRSSSHSNLNQGTLSKSGNYSKYNNDDDDDDYRWSPSKTANNSKYGKPDYSSSKTTTRSKFEDDDYNTSKLTSSKPTGHSKYSDDDDDYHHRTTSSKPTITHSKYSDDDDDDDYHHRTTSSKPTTHSKYSDDDDDDDDYRSSTKKNTHPPSYGSSVARSRFDNDDFFTTKDGSHANNRFRKTTDYDS